MVKFFKLLLSSLLMLNIFGCHYQEKESATNVVIDFLLKINNDHEQVFKCEYLNSENKMETCGLLVNKGEINEWKGMPKESIANFNKLLDNTYKKMNKLFNDISYTYVEGANYKDSDLFLRLTYENNDKQVVKVYFYKDDLLKFSIGDKTEAFYRTNQNFYQQFYSIVNYFDDQIVKNSIK